MAIFSIMDIFHQVTKYSDKMKIALTQETNLSLDKIQVINNLSSSLQDHFKDLNYGEDVNQILIGIICIKPEFDFFYKVRKPKYTKKEEIKNDLGETIEINNVVSFDVKFKYEILSGESIEIVQKIIASEILSSSKNMKSFFDKIKKFDRDSFIADMESFFNAQNII